MMLKNIKDSYKMKVVYNNDTGEYLLMNKINNLRIPLYQEIYKSRYKKYVDDKFNDLEYRYIINEVHKMIGDKKLYLYLIKMNKDIYIECVSDAGVVSINFNVYDGYRTIDIHVDRKHVISYDINDSVAGRYYNFINNDIIDIIDLLGKINNIYIEY